jgi:hypothetical protein
MFRFEDPMRAYDRSRLLAERSSFCARLIEALDMEGIDSDMDVTDHLLYKFHAIPKGRLLLFRSLLLLHPPHTHQLLDLLTHDFYTFALPTQISAHDDKLAQVASDVLYSMTLLMVSEKSYTNMNSSLDCNLICI